jgi:hypothetical protein
MVRAEGLEPPTLWFEARCSIQLSYARITENLPKFAVYFVGSHCSASAFDFAQAALSLSKGTVYLYTPRPCSADLLVAGKLSRFSLFG